MQVSCLTLVSCVFSCHGDIFSDMPIFWQYCYDKLFVLGNSFQVPLD